MHMFYFRVEKIAPACTEKYITEVSEIPTVVFLYDTHSELGNATVVFRNLHRSIFTNLTSLLINWLVRYARAVDHLAVKNVAQVAPLGGGSTLHLLQAMQPPRTHGQKQSRTKYRTI